MTKDEALKLALEALEYQTGVKHPDQIHHRNAAIAAIKEALTQPAQSTWIGLTDEELSEFDVDPVEAKLMIAKLKEKST